MGKLVVVYCADKTPLNKTTVKMVVNNFIVIFPNKLSNAV
jgi:hypothetical protein